MGSRNALIVDTETPYWPRGTYNYTRMTRRDARRDPPVLIATELAPFDPTKVI